VGFVMVNTNESNVQGKGQTLSSLEAREQRVRKPRSLRSGNRLNLRGINPRFFQREAADREQIAQVFACGEFGHHATVFGVELRLRRDNIRKNPAISDDRDARLVAGGLDGE
jgi:hypothetical protein